MSSPSVPELMLTGVTVFRSGLATTTIESFAKSAPVAPEPARRAMDVVDRVPLRSTTTNTGAIPIGTTASDPRSATPTGLPSAPRPTVRDTEGESTANTVSERSTLPTTTPTSTGSSTTGSGPVGVAPSEQAAPSRSASTAPSDRRPQPRGTESRGRTGSQATSCFRGCACVMVSPYG